MPKTTITPSLDLHALARVGAELQLQQLLDEQARIVAHFPELRALPSTKPDARRMRIARARVAAIEQPRDGERVCPYCSRTFALTHQQRTALVRTPDARIACPRPRCKAKSKSDYMRAYFAKRAAKSNGAAS